MFYGGERISHAVREVPRLFLLVTSSHIASEVMNFTSVNFTVSQSQDTRLVATGLEVSSRKQQTC